MKTLFLLSLIFLSILHHTRYSNALVCLETHFIFFPRFRKIRTFSSTSLGVKSFAIYYTYNSECTGVVSFIHKDLTRVVNPLGFFIHRFSPVFLFVCIYLPSFHFKSYFMYVFILRIVEPKRGIWKWGYDSGRGKRSGISSKNTAEGMRKNSYMLEWRDARRRKAAGQKKRNPKWEERKVYVI